jgi:hypothetical protein
VHEACGKSPNIYESGSFIPEGRPRNTFLKSDLQSETCSANFDQMPLPFGHI